MPCSLSEVDVSEGQVPPKLHVVTSQNTVILKVNNCTTFCHKLAGKMQEGRGAYSLKLGPSYTSGGSLHLVYQRLFFLFVNSRKIRIMLPSRRLAQWRPVSIQTQQQPSPTSRRLMQTERVPETSSPFFMSNEGRSSQTKKSPTVRFKLKKKHTISH
jgi:hypothetical protein